MTDGRPTGKWQIIGALLAALGGLAAAAQLLDYIKTGKTNLLLAPLFGALAVSGIVMILRHREWRTVLTGAGLATVIFAASFGAVAAFRDGSEGPPPPRPTPSPTTPVTTTTSPTVTEAPSSPSASGLAAGCPTTTPALAEVRDDFEDGRVDTCRWNVNQSATSYYYRKSGIQVYEQEGMLIFDVGPTLREGGDVEIFARSSGREIREMSADLVYLSRTGTSGGGSAGIIANFGTDGPIVSVDGGVGNGGTGYDVSFCPTDGAAYDDCAHPEGCESLRPRPNEPATLMIARAGRDVVVSIGGTICGRYGTDRTITAANLTMYAETGSAFRLGIDDFRMKYVS